MPLSSQSPLKQQQQPGTLLQQPQQQQTGVPQQQHPAGGQLTVVLNSSAQHYFAPKGGAVTGAPGREQAAYCPQSPQGGVAAPQGLGGHASTTPQPVISPAPQSGQFSLGAPGGQQASSKASPVIQLTGLGIMSHKL